MVVIGNYCRHRRLLKHDFGKPDGIRVPEFSPREIPFLGLIPTKELLTEFLRGEGHGLGPRAGSRGRHFDSAQ